MHKEQSLEIHEANTSRTEKKNRKLGKFTKNKLEKRKMINNKKF